MILSRGRSIQKGAWGGRATGMVCREVKKRKNLVREESGTG